jgi:hypothetical protein
MVGRMKKMWRGLWRPSFATITAFALLLPACSSAPDSPEGQIRALIARAEKAAEEKDIATLKGMISDDYSDRQGQDKQLVVRVVSYHFLRSKTIHLLTQIAKIDLQDAKHADVTVFLAMAGRAIQGFDQVSRLRADLYRIDFSVSAEKPKDWKVTRAEWRPAEMEDLGAPE